MLVHDALELIAGRRTQLNVTARTCGWSYEQRLHHMASMLLVASDRGEKPTVEQIAAACAYGLELLLVADRDEILDPASGEAA